jgi:hypothetical protein
MWAHFYPSLWTHAFKPSPQVVKRESYICQWIPFWPYHVGRWFADISCSGILSTLSRQALTVVLNLLQYCIPYLVSLFSILSLLTQLVMIMVPKWAFTCHSHKQANNAYVFPAIGHAASLAKWTSIPDDAFLLCAETLADMTTTEDLKAGRWNLCHEPLLIESSWASSWYHLGIILVSCRCSEFWTLDRLLCALCFIPTPQAKRFSLPLPYATCRPLYRIPLMT